ncbi:MAG: GlcG/HbpS family heme-binding protein [Xanthobacteraceae bacterium]
MRAISLAEANKIINGTFASARKRKAYALAAIVLDAGGRVKAFQKQDGASLMRFEIAYGKAFGALSLNRSSRQVLQKQREKPYFMANLEQLADGPLFMEGGGQLIRDATGEVVGALGVTGDVNEVDDLCAIDGIHVGGFRADADFDAKAAKRLNIKVDPPLRDPRKKR